MRFLRSYLKDHRRLILCLAVVGAAAACLFWLYELPPEPLVYTALVSAALACSLFVLPDFISYCRKASALEELRENLLSTLSVPELSGTYPEGVFADTVRALCQKVRELENLQAKKQREMMDYYTLWVHQVKTPLSAMRLILQSQKGYNENRETFEALAQELFKVERYVEMVLGYLRLDSMSSDLRLEKVRVHDVARTTVKKFAPQFIYQKLSLDLREFQNQVVTDEKWLQFVLEQLLSNALKYTREGTITLDMDENDVLYLRDTGVGISSEDLPRIFERGFTGRNGRAERNSSGLGLYLTKQVTDKLQNRVEIDSQPGKGTEVRLYLHHGEFRAY